MIKQTKQTTTVITKHEDTQTTLEELYAAYMNMDNDILYMFSNFITQWTFIKIGKVFIRMSEKLSCCNGDDP